MRAALLSFLLVCSSGACAQSEVVPLKESWAYQALEEYKQTFLTLQNTQSPEEAKKLAKQLSDLVDSCQARALCGYQAFLDSDPYGRSHLVRTCTRTLASVGIEETEASALKLALRGTIYRDPEYSLLESSYYCPAEDAFVKYGLRGLDSLDDFVLSTPHRLDEETVVRVARLYSRVYHGYEVEARQELLAARLGRHFHKPWCNSQAKQNACHVIEAIVGDLSFDSKGALTEFSSRFIDKPPWSRPATRWRNQHGGTDEDAKEAIYYLLSMRNHLVTFGDYHLKKHLRAGTEDEMSALYLKLMVEHQSDKAIPYLFDLALGDLEIPGHELSYLEMLASYGETIVPDLLQRIARDWDKMSEGRTELAACLIRQAFGDDPGDLDLAITYLRLERDRLRSKLQQAAFDKVIAALQH